MAFVKLDTGILRSTIWFDKAGRDVFLSALLMAEPREMSEPEPQLKVRSLDQTGWTVPAGWYGFVPAAGIGIITTAGLAEDVGLAALERLGNPEPESRSQAFDGRRLIRVDGGYIVLNFMKYRDKDHTAAARMRRLRARKRDVTERTVTEGRVQSTESRDQKAETENVGTYRPPPDVRAETSIRTERWRQERSLLAVVQQIAEREDKEPTEVMREVTAYKKKDGNTVNGRVNPALLTDERLDKSLEDATAWLEDLSKPK